LTKGDNNQVDDRGLYKRGQLWIKPSEIMGTVYGNVPYLGMFTIILNDYPTVKYVVIGLMFFSCMVTKDPS
jgi:signal peptidase